MEGLELLEKAFKSGLQVRADGDSLVVRGPRSAEPVALELLAHKKEVIDHLKAQSKNAFVPWVLQEWRRTAIPQWQHVLQEAKAEGDARRMEYARWILDEVLQNEDGEDA